MSSSPRVPDGLRWDDDHDEPYLVVPGHESIRITPFRKGDDQDVIAMYNDPAIGRWAFRRPYPYLPEDMSFVWDVLYPASRATADKLRPFFHAQTTAASSSQAKAQEANPPFDTVPSFPFSVVRETATGKVVGAFSIFVYTPLVPADISTSSESPGTVPGSGPTAASVFSGQGPQTVPPRDQIWEMAYDLAEGARGKGYAVSLVKSAIDNWARWVGIGTIRAQVEVSNLGSQAVTRKAGLQFMGTRIQDWPIEKGGGQRELGTWELRLQ